MWYRTKEFNNAKCVDSVKELGVEIRKMIKELDVMLGTSVCLLSFILLLLFVNFLNSVFSFFINL